MEKSFRSISQDPWNKLKVYVCLRLIENQNSASVRGQMLVKLAQVRQAFDPVMTLRLCEAALRISPAEVSVQNAVQDIIKKWVVNTTGSNTEFAGVGSAEAGVGINPEGQKKHPEIRQAKMPIRKQSRPFEHEQMHKQMHEQIHGQQKPAEAVQRAKLNQKEIHNENQNGGALQGIKAMHQQRREFIEQLRMQLRDLGIDGYVREMLKSKGVPVHVILEIQGFQPNWLGMVQFVDYLSTKRALTEDQCTDILDDLEQTLLLIEPQNPALPRLRMMRTSSVS